jgi:hypothetical protein
LTPTGSSSAKSPASDTGFTYPDEEATKKLSLHIYAYLIHAINDIAPSPLPVDQRPEPFLYWVDGLDCTTTLIKRYVFVFVTCVIFFYSSVQKFITPRYQKHTSLLVWLYCLYQQHTSLL